MRRKYAISLIPREYSSTDTTESVSDGQPHEVLADRKAVWQSEFYQAVANGFRPEITFVVWSSDYNGEDRLEYNNVEYEILRRFPNKEDTEIELICQRVENAEHNLAPLRDGF